MAENGLLAMIASGGMPTTPPPDAASLFETAYKLKDMKQQQQEGNALKAFLSNPENLGPDSLPTDNALKKLMTVAPTAAMHLVGEDAKIRNERALGEEHAQKAALDTDNYVQKGVRQPAMNAYDEAIKAGKTPEAAQAIGQKVYDEGVKELSQSGVFSKDQIAQFDPSFDPDRVRARSKINTLKNADKWQVLSDPSTGEQYRYNPQTAEATTLDGKPYDPKGAARIGGGTARSGVAQYLSDYRDQFIRDNGRRPTAREEAQAMADYHATIVSGQATAKADSSSLTNITKINDASTAFENTAVKNFDLALKLAKASPTKPNYGPWLNKWVQDGEIALGDPNMPPAVAALLTGANEYAKVMAGSTGSQGSTVDSRNEARELFSPYLNTGQIEPVIDVAKKDMENKKSSYAAQIEEIKSRIGQDNPSRGGDDHPSRGGGSKLPRDLPSAIGVPDGAKVKNKAGQVVAVMHNGSWAAP